MQPLERYDLEILEQAIARVRSLAHFYQRQVSRSQNQKIKAALHQLSREKSRQARVLENVLLKSGRRLTVAVPVAPTSSADRELIPRAFRFEQDLYLWFREHLRDIRENELKSLLEMLLNDELHHLQLVKGLYRGVTHC